MLIHLDYLEDYISGKKVDEYSGYMNSDIFEVEGKTLENDQCEIIGVIQSKTLIENADSMNRPCFKNSCEISFSCLQRFYRVKDKIDKKLASGKIKLIDYVNSSYIYERSRPGSGYTKLRDGCWHRSGAAVLRDAEKKITILMGVDDNQYFAVELPKHVTSVDKAFDCLIPKEVRGKSYMRQGEWFAIPINKRQVPKIHECLTTNEVNLMLESAGSNIHRLTGTIRIKNNIIFAKDFYLTHPQHETMRPNNTNKWYTFYKNTALRSFSEEGVD